MPAMLNFAGIMKMSDVKWTGLIHEKLFSEQPSEYTTKIDPIEPQSNLLFIFIQFLFRNGKSQSIQML